MKKYVLILFFILNTGLLLAEENNVLNLGMALGFAINSPIQFNYIKKLGISHVSMNLYWNEIEPEKGKFLWNKVSAITDNASENQVFIVRVTTKSHYKQPFWATSKDGSGRGKGMVPNDLNDYYDFIYKVTKKLKDKVKYIQNNWEPEHKNHGAEVQNSMGSSQKHSVRLSRLLILML